MRIFVTIVAALLACAFASTTGTAQTTANAPQFAQYYDFISKVQVGDDHFLLINVTGDSFSTAHGCEQRWFARSTFRLSHDRTKAQLQVAMASFLSRSKIWVQTTQCTGCNSCPAGSGPGRSVGNCPVACPGPQCPPCVNEGCFVCFGTKPANGFPGYPIIQKIQIEQ
jgi:hypothetical protein